MFNGNLHKSVIEFHTFSTDDLSLSAIGLATYNKSSIERYFDRKNDEDIKSYFNQAPLDDIKNKLLAIDGTIEDISILRFNKETLKYELASGSDIFQSDDGTSVASTLDEFLVKHRNLQLGKMPADDESTKQFKEALYSIQNSLSGCITFRTSYTVLNCERQPQIKITFQKRSSKDDSRKVALKGSPLIVDVGRRATGAEYSIGGTDNSPPAVYQKLEEGGINNPKNTVAAPMDLRYNNSTGKWQGGTHQILARLVTDLDPAPQISFELAVEELKQLQPSDWFDPDGDKNISPFKPGLALPLSVEYGNPHQFGPNFIGCKDGAKKVETIMVTNRSGRSFSAGDTVLCSNIDNEWIVQALDSGDSQAKINKKLKIGKWSFQKYIVNSDNFFKDARYVNTDIANGLVAYRNNITPDLYEQKMRNKFYMDMFQGEGDSAGKPWSNAKKLKDAGFDVNSFAKLNMYIDLSPEDALKKPLMKEEEYDIQVAEYYQSTVFDQLAPSLGGTNEEGHVIGRTNVKVSPVAEDNLPENSEFLYQNQLPFFWGPLFPDGYSAAQVSLRKNNNIELTPMNGFDVTVLPDKSTSLTIYNNVAKFFFTENKNTSFENSRIDGLVLNSNIFGDEFDANARQLPAEVALNGYKNPNASPIELMPDLNFEDKNAVDIFHNYLTSQSFRYSWLAQLEQKGDKIVGFSDSYGLTPLKPNYIQFSPLQLEAALHKTAVSNVTGDDLQYNNFKQTVNENIANLFISYDAVNFHSNKFYERNGLTKNGISVEGQFAKLDMTYLFGPYVYQPTVAPMGGPGIIPLENSTERGNLIGIIASKNKFTASKNGSITLTTRQLFGLPPRVTIAGGQGPSVTILGPFIGWSFGGNEGKQYSYPQWGDRLRDNRYDSLGTTALHVRIFDGWPDEQTVYDGRYFSVLHFNPFPTSGNIYDVQSTVVNTGVKYTKDWTPAQINVSYEKSVDQITTSVDFRVPTYMHPTNSSIDNKVIPVGTIVTKDGINGAALRPPSEWRVNPIRRGALLTKGGFRYYKSDIGINGEDFTIKNAGTGYVPGEIITLKKGAKIKVSTTGSNGAISAFDIIDSGSNFAPPDFEANNGSGVSISSTDGEGVGAAIFFKTGMVYSKMEHDQAPKEHVKPTRISLPDKQGEDSVDGSLSTSFSFEDGLSNAYDAFYFMHNDILHTFMSQTPFAPGFAQYIDLEIGAG